MGGFAEAARDRVGRARNALAAAHAAEGALRVARAHDVNAESGQ